ncbi:hypothetical protein [Pseudonocardia zijingensis]|uniref:Uncharacterized protein n=1 Tax=Pseudonocardia zijingensis TaxID=153376 RepID=A0ABN1PXE6_9PSEU
MPSATTAPAGYITSVVNLDGPLTDLGRAVLDLSVHTYGGQATYNTDSQLVVKMTAQQVTRRLVDELYG